MSAFQSLKSRSMLFHTHVAARFSSSSRSACHSFPRISASFPFPLANPHLKVARWRSTTTTSLFSPSVAWPAKNRPVLDMGIGRGSWFTDAAGGVLCRGLRIKASATGAKVTEDDEFSGIFKPPSSREREMARQKAIETREFEHARIISDSYRHKTQTENEELRAKGRRYMRKVLIGTGILSSIVCYLAYQAMEDVPISHRKHFVYLPPEWEKLMASLAEQSVLDEYSPLQRVSSESESHQRVALILQKLQQAAFSVSQDRAQQLNWSFQIIENSTCNAFCLPDGRMVVYTGLLELVGKDDDQLAVVLGHEVAHALASHHGEQLLHSLLFTVFSSVILYSIFGTVNTNAVTLTRTLGSLSFDRSLESEADQIGLHLLHRAGFRLDAATTFWQNMMANDPLYQNSQDQVVTEGELRDSNEGISSEKWLSYLQTHPSHKKRCSDIQKWIAEIENSSGQK